MGCSGSKTSDDGLLYTQTDYDMTDPGIAFDKLGELFKDASTSIKELEELRKIIIDNRDELVIVTGASSFIDPTIENCLKCLLWLISFDNEGNISEAGIECDTEGKKISLTGNKTSSQTQTALTEYQKYLNSLTENNQKLSQISEKLIELKDKFTNGNELENEYVSKLKESGTDQVSKYLSQFRKNVDKLKRACITSNKLKDEVKLAFDTFNDIPALISDKTRRNKIDKIGCKALTFAYVKPNEISWNLIDDVKQRYGKNPEEGLKFWDNRMNQKKVS